MSAQPGFDSPQILIVDDEPKNLDALTRILHNAGYTNTYATSDPTEGLTLYSELDPDLLLLDLNMPVLDGLAIMERLKQVAPRHGYLSVLVLTGDTSRQARRRAPGYGCKRLFTKPFEIDEVLLRIHNLLETRQLHREITTHNLVLEERVRERTIELGAAQIETLERLARAAEFRDDETGRHTQRVGRLAALLGREIGLNEEEIVLLRRAAPLHDVGKIGIADWILLKPGPLTGAERATMQTHTTIGAKILSGGRSPVMRVAEEIALCHHEKWDGSGYPAGRVGERVPLTARIVAVAHVFDALSSARVYRPAWPMDEVFAQIKRQRGIHFDPVLSDVCRRRTVREELIAISRDATGRDFQGLFRE